jgi:rod shape-determining protein MreD
MSIPRSLATLAFFFVLFTIQESVISLIHFPLGGFSLYLAISIALITLEDNNGAIVMGFLSGVVLDLSPTSHAPFGQWALILTVVAYIFAANKESIADLTLSPLTFVLFVTFGVSIALLVYLAFGTLLGEGNGSLSHDSIIVLANAVWTLLFTPIFLPALRSVRRASLTSRER